jgi:hypothetical protein
MYKNNTHNNNNNYNIICNDRIKQTLMQAARLRAHGQFINEKAFNTRKAHLIRPKTGLLREKVPGPTNPMSNPMAMVDMMKGNLIFMLPNIALMGFVGYFFSGFLCLKLPFSVPSNHFRSMLQRGVDLNALDISYVSSLSWYFLVTFGLNGVLGLLLGDSSASDQMMQMQVCLFCFIDMIIIYICIETTTIYY